MFSKAFAFLALSVASVQGVQYQKKIEFGKNGVEKLVLATTNLRQKSNQGVKFALSLNGKYCSPEKTTWGDLKCDDSSPSGTFLMKFVGKDTIKESVSGKVYPKVRFEAAKGAGASQPYCGVYANEWAAFACPKDSYPIKDNRSEFALVTDPKIGGGRVDKIGILRVGGGYKQDGGQWQFCSAGGGDKIFCNVAWNNKGNLGEWKSNSKLHFDIHWEDENFK